MVLSFLLSTIRNTLRSIKGENLEVGHLSIVTKKKDALEDTEGVIRKDYSEDSEEKENQNK